MISRDAIRKCLERTIDSFKRDKYAKIYEHRDAILETFDWLPCIDVSDPIMSCIDPLADRFPNSDWGIILTIFEIYYAELTAELPRQSLPPISLSLSHNGQPLKPGLTRIGGSPEWIQMAEKEHPVCSDCSEVMAFLCQVASLGNDNPDSRLAEYKFVDAGIFYLFGCIKCGETYSTFQTH